MLLFMHSYILRLTLLHIAQVRLEAAERARATLYTEQAVASAEARHKYSDALERN